MFRENEYRASNGLTALIVMLLVGLGALALLMKSAAAQMPGGVLLSLLVLVLTCIMLGGLVHREPRRRESP